jgi:hypothetical protein
MPNPKKAAVDRSKFNTHLALPYQLRIADFEMTLQDVYDFFHDVNSYLMDKGFQRLDEMIRPAGLSGMLSDMLTDAMGKHSRVLAPNTFHNGHPDLVVRGRYPQDAVEAGEEGVEVKATRGTGGAVDTHGARDQTMCVFTYEVDNSPNKAAHEREPLVFREVYIAEVQEADFRRNERGERGTRTATLHADGLTKLRAGKVYYDIPPRVTRRGGHSEWRPRKSQ